MIKTVFCWFPVPLYVRKPEEDRIEHIGFVWFKRAQLIKNFYLGWITFPEYVNPPKRCKKCGEKMEVN